MARVNLTNDILIALNPEGIPGRRVVATEFYDTFELPEGVTKKDLCIGMAMLMEQEFVRAVYTKTIDGSYIPDTLEITAKAMVLLGDRLKF